MKVQKPVHRLVSFVVLVSLAGLVAALWYFTTVENNVKRSEVPEIADTITVTDFKSCVAAGNPVMESFPEQCQADGQTYVNEQQVNDGYSEPLASGQGRFTVRFPDNWGEILKPLDSDWFIIPGQEQPEGELQIVDTESYGSDSPSVFSLFIHDNVAPAEGTSEEYTLVNGKENPIVGKKYVKVYEEDTEVGIGIQRFAGDRDYQYVFPLADGNELWVWYSVYGQDPRNNVETVEAIIDSIRLN